MRKPYNLMPPDRFIIIECPSCHATGKTHRSQFGIDEFMNDASTLTCLACDHAWVVKNDYLRQNGLATEWKPQSPDWSPETKEVKTA